MSDLGTAHLRHTVLLRHGRRPGFDSLQLQLAPANAANRASAAPSSAANPAAQPAT